MKPMNVVIANDLDVIGIRFANNVIGARIIKEKIMYDASPPAQNSVPPAITSITYKRVSTSIKVSSIIMRPEIVFLGPVQLEIGERHVICTRKNCKDVWVLVHLLQVFAMLF